MATTPITRVTMIKLPSEEHLTIALKGFKTFAQSQQKDGVPYILSMEAGPAEGHVREQGYTFATKSVFKNMEDVRYYETKCPAHEQYKVFLKMNAPVAGLMSVHFQPAASFDFTREN